MGMGIPGLEGGAAMSIVINPRAVTPASDAFQAAKPKSKAEGSETLSFTGSDGRSFNLTITREQPQASVVYGRPAPAAKPAVAETEHQGETKGLLASDPMLLKAMKEFRDEVLAQLMNTVGGEGETPVVPPEAQAKAAQIVNTLKISEDLTISMDVVDTEYWSVENTAGRLVDFAKSLYGGGDRAEHLSKMIDGIDQGFAAAKEAFGGELPDISQQTVDLAKKMLTDWAGKSQEQTA